MQVDLNLELHPQITPEGIQLNVYFGDSDTPTTLSVPWDDFIEEEFSYHTLANAEKPIVVSDQCNGVSEIIEVIKSLRKVTDKMSEGLLERPIFMRQKWVDAGSPPGEINRFYVDFETYLDIVDSEDD